MHTDAALALAIALAAGVLAQCAARLVHLPSIVLLLATGVALGPEGLAWVEPAALGDARFGIVDFAIAVILFESALNLDLRRLRREEQVIRRLVTWGALVTFAGGALAARFCLGWPWGLSCLFGSIAVVTGPTVVGPLVRSLRLRPRLQTVLEAEGVLIDPIGALLAVLVLQLVLAPGAMSVAGELRDVLFRLAFGAAAGLVAGLLMAQLLRLRAFVQGLENILALALVVLLFHLCEHVLSQSGLLAVTLAGVVVGNSKTPVDRDLREFKDQLAVLLIGVIFVILAADVRMADVRGLGWAGLAVLGSMMLLVRPLAVYVATGGADLTTAERAFVAGIAPRGIVAAAVASLTAVALNTQGIAGGDALRAMVFLLISGTVVLNGLLAWPLARALGLRLPGRNRVAILGAQGLGLSLGRELSDAKVDVVFVDADPKRCHVAEEAGFTVVFGDGLQDRTLLRLRPELIGTAIGLTFNDHLNSLFVAHAMERHGVPRGLVSLESFEGGKPPAHIKRPGVDVLFEGPHDQERWDVRWRHGDIVVEQFEFRPASNPETTKDSTRAARDVQAGDRFVVLAVRRGDRVMPMTLGAAPKAGDVASVALYRREREEALPSLARLGWRPVTAPESRIPNPES